MSMIADHRETVSLSSRMAAGSRSHQDAVRQSAFIAALTARRLPWKAYADWVAQQFFLHESLQQAEAAMAGERPQWALLGPETGVLSALAVDLEFLHGPGWARRIAARSATTTYCTRLRDVAVAQALGYVAHHYARHVQDLQDGRHLRPAVAAAYGLQDAGCSFVTLHDAEPSLFTTRYANLIDTAPWTTAARKAMVRETANARQMYLEVLKELGRYWA